MGADRSAARGKSAVELKTGHGVARWSRTKRIVRGVGMLLATVLPRVVWAASVGLALLEGSHAQGVAPNAERRFSTTFPMTENPISEGGVWHHSGYRWKQVRTVAGHAVGTQTGTGGYDDSYVYLAGFGPNQTARAVVWRDPAIKGNYREVELLLRWSDTPTEARGYECNLSWDGSYAQIVRWNGAFGDFTYLANQATFPHGVMPPRTGDIFTARISGDVISVLLNKNDGHGDRLLVSASDNTYAEGNPGMGFFIQGRLDPAQFGFSDFSASSQ
jgi:hypothetical protein